MLSCLFVFCFCFSGFSIIPWEHEKDLPLLQKELSIRVSWGRHPLTKDSHLKDKRETAENAIGAVICWILKPFKGFASSLWYWQAMEHLGVNVSL